MTPPVSPLRGGFWRVFPAVGRCRRPLRGAAGGRQGTPRSPGRAPGRERWLLPAPPPSPIPGAPARPPVPSPPRAAARVGAFLGRETSPTSGRFVRGLHDRTTERVGCGWGTPLLGYCQVPRVPRRRIYAGWLLYPLPCTRYFPSGKQAGLGTTPSHSSGGSCLPARG